MITWGGIADDFRKLQVCPDPHHRHYKLYRLGGPRTVFHHLDAPLPHTTAAAAAVSRASTAAALASTSAMHARTLLRSVVLRPAAVRRFHSDSTPMVVLRPAAVRSVVLRPAARVRGFHSDTTPMVVPARHSSHSRVMKELIKATGPWQLLRVFESYGHPPIKYGWQTAIETINRIAKKGAHVQTLLSKPDASDARVACDERFHALLAIPSRALQQSVMSSTARTGEHTDDLSSLKASLEALKLKDTELYRRLNIQLASELEPAAPAVQGRFFNQR